MTDPEALVLLDRAADAAEALLGEGLAAAQNAFHGGVSPAGGNSGGLRDAGDSG